MKGVPISTSRDRGWTARPSRCAARFRRTCRDDGPRTGGRDRPRPRFGRGGRCFGWKPSSSSNLYIRAFRACSLAEIRHTAPCRAKQRQQHLSQRYPPPRSHRSRTPHPTREARGPTRPRVRSKWEQWGGIASCINLGAMESKFVSLWGYMFCCAWTRVDCFRIPRGNH